MPLSLRFGAFRIYRLSRLKTNLAVRAVAERFVRRRATAAQGNLGSALSRNPIARGVVNLYIAFNEIRSIWFWTNRNVCHVFPL